MDDRESRTTTAALIAIEGPCCAGKTTLASGLVTAIGADLVTIVPDYADIVGGGAGMPDPDPKSVADELIALEALLVVEGRRFLAAKNSYRNDGVILIDRSVLTLLAHCGGLEQKNEYTDSLLSVTQQVLRNDNRCVWPERVIYLDVDHATQAARNTGKFAPESVFLNPAYNAGFRAYFEDYRRRNTSSVVWIDGTATTDRISATALRFIGPIARLDR